MILNKYYGRKSAGETASIKVYAPQNRLVSATKGEKVREGVWDANVRQLIPVMTSDTSPYGTAISSTPMSGQPAYFAFDGDNTSSFVSNTYAGGEYLGYEFGKKVIIHNVAFDWAASSEERTVHLVLQTLKSGTWETVYDVLNGSTTGFHKVDVVFDTPIACEGIRLYYVSVSSAARLYVKYLEAYGTEPCFLITDIDEYGDWDVSIETPRLYLYNAGDECTDVTGGWSADDYTWSTVEIVQPVKNADNMFLSSGSGSKTAIAGTTFAIDMTNYSKIFIDCVTANVANAMYFRTLETKAVLGTYATTTSIQQATRGVITVDISQVSGLKYFAFASDDSTRNGTVYAVWLE